MMVMCSQVYSVKLILINFISSRELVIATPSYGIHTGAKAAKMTAENVTFQHFSSKLLSSKYFYAATERKLAEIRVFQNFK